MSTLKHGRITIEVAFWCSGMLSNGPESIFADVSAQLYGLDSRVLLCACDGGPGGKSPIGSRVYSRLSAPLAGHTPLQPRFDHIPAYFYPATADPDYASANSGRLLLAVGVALLQLSRHHWVYIGHVMDTASLV